MTEGDRYNYITQTKDGKILRSSSTYFKNSKGETIGALCINFDISDFLVAENTLRSLTMHSLDQEVKEVFVNDVNDLLEYLLQECQKEIGKPVSHMNKEDKLKAIQFLDMRGAFLVKKQGTRCASFWTFRSSHCTTTSMKSEPVRTRPLRRICFNPRAGKGRYMKDSRSPAVPRFLKLPMVHLNLKCL